MLLKDAAMLAIALNMMFHCDHRSVERLASLWLLQGGSSHDAVQFQGVMAAAKGAGMTCRKALSMSSASVVEERTMDDPRSAYSRQKI